MERIELSTTVDAPRERVFDLARSVDLHVETGAEHDERAIAGTTAGLLDAGDRVTWRARHFGIPFEMTVHIATMDRPGHFRDELVAGPFADLVHDHRFDGNENGDGTVMRDEFRFASPVGPVGRAVDRLVLRRHLRSFLERRNRELKAVAESDRWREFLG